MDVKEKKFIKIRNGDNKKKNTWGLISLFLTIIYSYYLLFIERVFVFKLIFWYI